MSPNKIFHLGLPRSGTTTLHLVLERLGYHCIHNPTAMLGGIIPELVDSADAFGDAPIPLYFKELDRLYPGSKFIITIREKEAWLDSVEWLYTHGAAHFWWNEASHDYHIRFLGSKCFDREILSERYDSYHRDVTDHFQERPNDLLVLTSFTPEDIERICRFLGIPVVRFEIPRSNARFQVSLHRRFTYWATEALGISTQAQMLWNRIRSGITKR